MNVAHKLSREEKASSSETFEKSLVDAIEPIRQFILASSVYQLFKTGLYDFLAAHSAGVTVESAATTLKLDHDRTHEMLWYSVHEGILNETGGAFSLTQKGRNYEAVRGWYTMLIGGYGQTFLDMGDHLASGSAPCGRKTKEVGVGSCGISHYDAIPLTKSLMAKAPRACTKLLDIGCGNGRYLIEFCEAVKGLEAWGVEPSPGGYQEAQALVAAAGLQNTVKLTCATAQDFLQSAPQSMGGFTPNFAVFGFLLHEILGQDGEEGVRHFLRGLFKTFPDIQLIVIEVENAMTDREAMRHPLAMAYYNGYFLMHPFTNQRLMPSKFWEKLFESEGLSILARETTNPDVDSTGFEVGYLLERRRA